MIRKINLILGMALFLNTFAYFSNSISSSENKIVNSNFLRRPVILPVEIVNCLEGRINLFDLYDLGIVLKKRNSSIIEYDHEKHIIFSIQCFKYIIEQYRNCLPISSKQLNILSRSYYQLGKLDYESNNKEYALLNFLIAKDLGLKVSTKYLEQKIGDKDNFLNTIYELGVTLECNKKPMDLEVAFKCFEYVITKCKNLIDGDIDRAFQDLLGRSYYHLGKLAYKIGDYNFAEKQLKLAVYLNSDDAIQFIRSRKWIDKRAFPPFQSYY